ncbi:MAG TPA: hypothetical protein VL283_05040 [Candidatus Baltobacteraceae bacterium]|nr:hypothetical protein [Candidatus Baltobacteraceae bacterium]
MSDPQRDAVLERITAYDGTEEQFASIVTEALALFVEPKLTDFKKELGRRLGRLPPSTIDRYARGTACPGAHVRPAVLDEVRDILASRP